MVLGTVTTLAVWWWDVTMDWELVSWRPFQLFPRPLHYSSKAVRWIRCHSVVGSDGADQGDGALVM